MPILRLFTHFQSFLYTVLSHFTEFRLPCIYINNYKVIVINCTWYLMFLSCLLLTYSFFFFSFIDVFVVIIIIINSNIQTEIT